MGLTGQQVIDLLGLKPHPTCVFVAETFRSQQRIPQAALPARYEGGPRWDEQLRTRYGCHVRADHLDGAALASASGSGADAEFRLDGWAEIPSTYRRPASPVSGQFTTGPVNGVTPPYQGQPIPGFSGVIPFDGKGRFIGLPAIVQSLGSFSLIALASGGVSLPAAAATSP